MHIKTYSVQLMLLINEPTFLFHLRQSVNIFSVCPKPSLPSISVTCHFSMGFKESLHKYTCIRWCLMNHVNIRSKVKVMRLNFKIFGFYFMSWSDHYIYCWIWLWYNHIPGKDHVWYEPMFRFLGQRSRLQLNFSVWLKLIFGVKTHEECCL